MAPGLPRLLQVTDPRSVPQAGWRAAKFWPSNHKVRLVHSTLVLDRGSI
jgi:hypothetical protein